MTQRQADVVIAVQQTVLAERGDLERILAAVARAHDLRLEVDRQLIAVERVRVVEQVIDLLLGQHDRQQPVLVAVVEEDVGEARRDDRAEAVLLERPRRVLARAAAAEVLAGEQHRRALVARLVQHEVGVQRALRVVLAGLAVVEVTPFVERVRAEARALDRLQELLRDDRVGVDVLAIERRHDAGMHIEFFHDPSIRLKGRHAWPAHIDNISAGVSPRRAAARCRRR
ncbi:hypothetical protein BvRS1_08780 [Burkholderia vietnamiensis]|nr:hypothetical protein BvRS1_08780 [Burkholderia vietnamiensis]